MIAYNNIGPITKAQGPSTRAQGVLRFDLEGPRTRGNITTVQESIAFDDKQLVGSDVVVQGFPYHYVSNQAEPQADQLLDQEWTSNTETLKKTFEPQEDQAELQADPVLDQEWRSYTETLNTILDIEEEEEREACDQIDAVALKELSDDNIFSKPAEPEGKEVEQEQQVLLVEHEEQQVLLAEPEEQQVVPVEQ
ncbi:hypothetical protein AgCh_012192 [Apium graveolens]